MRNATAARARSKNKTRTSMPKRPVAAAAQRQRPQIAVVGDSQMAEGVKRTLGGLNVSVRGYEDLDTALDGLTAEVHALVLTMPLPETEVFAAVSRARAEAPGLPLCVVVPDGFSDRRAGRLYEAGTTAVFEWPYESLTLPAMLAGLIGSAPRKGEEGDKALRRAVRARLKLAAEIAEDVTAKVRGGTAIVEGTVPSLWMRTRLVQTLEHVPGVRGVSAPDLLVDPPERPDDELARNVRSVLRNVASVDPNTLSVAVDDGKVSLAGVVDRHRELQRLLDIVSNVRGVRDIDNHVTVSNQAAKSSRQLANRVRSGLETMYADAQIDVAAFGNVVVLRGETSKLSEKRGACDLAMSMSGVERVVDKLVVSK